MNPMEFDRSNFVAAINELSKIGQRLGIVMTYTLHCGGHKAKTGPTLFHATSGSNSQHESDLVMALSAELQGLIQLCNYHPMPELQSTATELLGILTEHFPRFEIDRGQEADHRR